MNDIEIELMNTVRDLLLKEGIRILNIEITGSKISDRAEIVIDSQKGITINDCANVSNIIKDTIRVNDKFMDLSDMSIEVSSPGINRQLYILEDYQSYMGEKVIVKLKRAVKGRRTLKGKIFNVKDNLIGIEINGEITSILFEDIKKTNLQRDIKV